MSSLENWMNCDLVTWHKAWMGKQLVSFGEWWFWDGFYYFLCSRFPVSPTLVLFDSLPTLFHVQFLQPSSHWRVLSAPRTFLTVTQMESRCESPHCLHSLYLLWRWNSWRAGFIDPFCTFIFVISWRIVLNISFLLWPWKQKAELLNSSGYTNFWCSASGSKYLLCCCF